MRSLIFIFIFFCSLISYGQQYRQPDGGGEYKFKTSQPELTDAERLAIRVMLDKNKAALLKEGKLKTSGNNTLGSFGWPVGPYNGNDDYNVFGISGFVDHDTSYPDALLDYYGGDRTYDRESGYNHQGTDFFTWPFPFLRMDNDEAAIFAMESGTIIGKADGNYDRNCAAGSGSWNAVYVQHGDYEAWYGHMKNGSLTSKSAGETVAKGEFLGIIGSSGSSTGPHLHLEIYDASDNLIDPFEGPHNPSIAASMWENQPPYYEPQVNSLTTNFAPPVYPGCPDTETPNESDVFSPGDTIYFVTYYRDQLDTVPSTYTIYTPSNSVWQQWTHSISESHYSASYWYWYFTGTSGMAGGNWKFAVEINGNTYEHNFSISTTGISDNSGIAPNSFALMQNYPNPFNPVTVINYNVAERSGVKLYVYDALGNEIAVLVDEEKPAGRYSVRYDGSGYSSGIYFVKMTAGDYSSAIKIILTK